MVECGSGGYVDDAWDVFLECIESTSCSSTEGITIVV